MSESEIRQLNKKLDEIMVNQASHLATHDELKKQITELETRLSPVIEVYNAFKGFGGVAWWIFRFIVIPLSVVVGIILSIKNWNK